MRLLIVGALEGQLSEATKLAMDGGAKVAHAGTVDVALTTLRAGRGADLLLVDVMADIPGLIAALDAERFVVPVVACGTETNAAAAVNAIRAGAKEYIPLPPDAELIAAVIAAVARESSDFLYRDPAMSRVVQLADQIAIITNGVIAAEGKPADLKAQMGGEAIRAAASASSEYAEVMDRVVPLADKYNDQLAQLKQNFSIAGLGIANDLLPWLNKVVASHICRSFVSQSSVSF